MSFQFQQSTRLAVTRRAAKLLQATENPQTLQNYLSETK